MHLFRVSKPLFRTTSEPMLRRRISSPPVHHLFPLLLLAVAAIGGWSCGGPQSEEGAGAADEAVVVEASDLTLEEILQRHREAVGGDALDAVVTVRKVGTMDSSAFTGAPAEALIRDGEFFRRTIESPRGAIVFGFDGERAWQKGTTPEQVEPEWSGERNDILFAALADVDGPLVDPAASGHEVELVGKVDGDYRLTLRLGGEVEQVVDLDGETFLIHRMVEARSFPQGTLDLVTRYSEYREVEGVQFAGRVATSMEAIQFDQAMIWSEIEVGGELDDAVFAFPGVVDN